MRVKITIEIERNGYTATETVEYIDRTPADITAEMAGQLQRLQAACNLRDRLRYEADDAMAAYEAEWKRQTTLTRPLTVGDRLALDRLWERFCRANGDRFYGPMTCDR